MLALKQYRSRKRGFSDLLNSAAVIEDGIILNKDGSLMAAWQYDGPDTESATAGERNHLSAQLNAILARLGTGYMLHVDAIRLPAVSYPHPSRSAFPDAVSQLIDEERRRHFQSAGSFFESRDVLVLTYNPPDMRASKVASMMYTETGSRRESYADAVLCTFRRTCEEIERALDNVFRVQRLGAEEVTDAQGRTVVFDRFLQHLNVCITGNDHPIALPPIPMYVDALLGDEFVSAITPMIGDTYIVVVAIDGFPSDSHSGILNILDQLAIPYRWSTRFIFLDNIDAQKLLAKVRRQWLQKTRSLIDPDGIKPLIARWNGTRNLYYAVNVWHPGLTKKASKGDVVWAEFVQADLDPREGETPDQAKARYRAALDAFVKGFGLRPTIEVDSGNGVQVLWKLKTAVKPEMFEQVEGI